MKTYFIYDGYGLVKIGKALNPEKRIKELQTGNGRKLTLLGYIDGDQESVLHSQFKPMQSHGEWFRCEPVLADFLLSALNLTTPQLNKFVNSMREHYPVEMYQLRLPEVTDQLSPSMLCDVIGDLTDVNSGIEATFVDHLMDFAPECICDLDEHDLDNNDCDWNRWCDGLLGIINNLVVQYGINFEQSIVTLDLKPITSSTRYEDFLDITRSALVLDDYGWSVLVRCSNMLTGTQYNMDNACMLYYQYLHTHKD